ncbi:MAG: molecular chaperone [Proteobacteria bacterium]|nr:molecular chaperone [Pseudomonadota bacterium]MDE2410599.1 molecular chaperone [Sphingomonadales bacterium]
MIRRVAVISKLAIVAAGGSFLSLGLHSAARADDTAVAAAAPSADRGARLNVAPLRLELDATKTGATVMLTNTSARPLPVQTRLFAWSQEGGEDRYAPSTALTVSPSIISIAPGTTQIVRVLRIGAASPGEKRFRLAIDQLPDPTLARSGEAEARLRFTLPVFVDRDKATPAALAWRIVGNQLELANSGGSTAKIMNLEVRNAAGTILPVQRNGLRYVLGGATIDWGLASGCTTGSLTISAQIDGQTAHAQVSPSCG